MTTMIVERDVPAVMRDGVILRADVFRPDDDARHPVLLARSPYDKSVILHFAHLDPAAAVARGYAVVLQDTRGRFTSDGEWLPWIHETDDGYDTVAWAASLDFSDGTVGMWGSSYFGNTQWRAAISGAPALKAIVPAVTWATPLDGLFERNGIPEHGLNVAWSLETGIGHFTKGGRAAEVVEAVDLYDSLAGEGYAQMPPGRIPFLEAQHVPDIGLRRYLADPGTSREAEVIDQLESVTIPALHLGGWYDIFVQGTLDMFHRQRQLGIDSRLVMGPWTHSEAQSPFVGATYFGLRGGGKTLDLRTSRDMLQLDFFDQHLRGLPPRHERPVLIFVMGINEWREEDEWPLARAVPTPLHLAAGGSLTAEPPAAVGEDAFDYDIAKPVPTIGGNTVMHIAYPSGAYDQSAVEARDDVLVYDSAPLTADLEVAGEITVTLFARSSAASTDWVVRLCDVHPDGRSINLADGIVRAPGDQEEHTFSLWSTCNVFRAGHRLRVHVTSGNFPRWGKNLEMATDDAPVAHQTVLRGGDRASRIVLPVTSGSLPA